MNHPQGHFATIYFNLVPKYGLTPASIIKYNVKENEPIKETIKIQNNYMGDFEIESTSSAQKTIKMIDGAPVMIYETEKIEKPVTVKVNVKDEDGNQVFEPSLGKDDKGNTILIDVPVTFNVPVMEKITKYYRKNITPAGELYGVRYEQLLSFIIGSL